MAELQKDKMDLPVDIMGEIFSYVLTDLESIRVAQRVCRKWRDLIENGVMKTYKKDYDAFYERIDNIFGVLKKIYMGTMSTRRLMPFDFDYVVRTEKNGKLHVEYLSQLIGGHTLTTRFEYKDKYPGRSCKRECIELMNYWDAKIESIKCYYDFRRFFDKLFTYYHLDGQFVITMGSHADVEKVVEEMGLTGTSALKVEDHDFVIIANLALYDSPKKDIWGSHNVANIIKRRTRFPFQEFPKDIREEILSYTLGDLESLKKTRIVCREWRDYIDSKVSELYTPFYKQFYSNVELLFAFVKNLAGEYSTLHYGIILDESFTVLVTIKYEHEYECWIIQFDYGDSKFHPTYYEDIGPLYRKRLDDIYVQCGIERSTDGAGEYIEDFTDAVVSVGFEDAVRIIHKLFVVNSMRVGFWIYHYFRAIGSCTHLLELLKVTKNTSETGFDGFREYDTITCYLATTDQSLCQSEDGFYMPRVLSNIVKRKLEEEEEQRNVKARKE